MQKDICLVSLDSSRFVKAPTDTETHVLEPSLRYADPDKAVPVPGDFWRNGRLAKAELYLRLEMSGLTLMLGMLGMGWLM